VAWRSEAAESKAMSNKVLVRLKNNECEARDLPAPTTRGLTISASVGVGGRNLPADVKAVQSALNNVPVAQGGPNPKLVPDSQIGPKTCAAIANFQKIQLGWSDSRVDPDNITMATLRSFQPFTPGSPNGPSPTPRDKTTIPRVYATLPNAGQLILGAMRYVDSSRDLLMRRTSSTDAQDRYATLNVFFHLDELPDALALNALTRIRGVFQNMQRALLHAGRIGNGHAIFQPDPLDQSDTYAYTYAGGFTRRDTRGGPKMSGDDNYEGPNQREDSIYICTGLEGKAGDFTAYNTVHELAHWVGPEIGQPDTILDFSYRHKADFYQLPAPTALRTADSYAMFSVAASQRGLAEDAVIFLPPMVIRGGGDE
jgi:hypothetical protein